LPRWVLVGATPGAGCLSATYTGISGATDHSTTNDRDGEGNQHAGIGRISRGGMLVSLEAHRLLEMSDGTSNTLVVGEQSDFLRNAAQAKIDGRSDFGHCFTMGPGAGETRTWNVTSVRYRINDKAWENKGVGDTYYGQNRPLQSSHTGGMNGVSGDGSVRFFRDTLPLQTLYNLCNRDDGNVITE